MRRFFLKIVMLLVFSSTLMSSRPFCAGDQQASTAGAPTPNSGPSLPQAPQFDHVVLLLRNGHVIEGTLIAIDDNYHVKVPHGEIYISRRDVVAVAASMRELYYQQQSRVFGEDPEPHLELAIWCAEHGLPEEARAELAEARRLAPEHPGLPLATRRVEMALVRQGERDAPPSRPAGDGSRTGQISPAQANVLNAGKKTVPPRNTVSPVPDLAVLLRGLPEDAREDFVSDSTHPEPQLCGGRMPWGPRCTARSAIVQAVSRSVRPSRPNCPKPADSAGVDRLQRAWRQPDPDKATPTTRRNAGTCFLRNRYEAVP